MPSNARSVTSTFSQQFVLFLRDPHLLEVDLDRDHPINTLGAPTQAQNLQRVRVGHLLLSPRLHVIGWTWYEFIRHLRFGLKGLRVSTITLMKSLKTVVCVMHTRNVDMHCATHRQLHAVLNVRFKTPSADLLRDSFRSPGHRLPTVRLSRKQHDFHREVTRRSQIFASWTTWPLDPQHLAFSDFRLDPECSLVLNHTILLEFAVAAASSL